MKEEICKECKCHDIGFQKKVWCNLAHAFVEKLGDFCPKEHKIEEIKKICNWNLPPERTNDGQSRCLAHLAEGTVMLCKIKELADLLTDPDFAIKTEVKNQCLI